MDFNRENISITIGRIIAHSISNTITPAEQAVLDEWLQDSTNRHIYTTICNNQPINERLSEFAEFDPSEGYQRFRVSIGKDHRIRYRLWMTAVAGVVFFLSVSVTIYIAMRERWQLSEQASSHRHDIAAGGNRATLKLADGRTITLDETQDGIVIEGGEITYNNGNPLTATDGSREGLEGTTLLELSTPNGGTYQITLSDGTKVWLNAASTLRYPPRFSGAERIVELTGEAYFSVANDKKRPFKVFSAGQEIHVLGTEFNVSAYSDDPENKTTLVEGKVSLLLTTQLNGTALQNSKFIELVSGEQGIVKRESLTKTHVDTEPYTAWKAGYFYFKKTPLEDILRQAARWYDVEVVYEGGIPNETFSGDIKRDVSLRGLLDILQHSTINVTLEERTLIVRNI